jgi:hypothetical protein
VEIRNGSVTASLLVDRRARIGGDFARLEEGDPAARRARSVMPPAPVAHPKFA